MSKIKVSAESVKVEYAGCGSHEVEVELEFGSFNAKALAREMRAEAQRIDPQDETAVLNKAATLIQQMSKLIEVATDVVLFREAGGVVLDGAVRQLDKALQQLEEVR